ncbi:hypothetical protein ABB37_00831 [Leptomonas pyrrhocoris]|uniref:C3H1-type domain-containing protein n=1 Tax=Leptomonas pyrrhocoris TaxID=157538 RepID=A0A0M9GBI6_LEPPY|nr:hypothetical protein ABB37_00831 [Leptomonas pyrrhocoris]KPA86756.1 hypothetical protein ABB37_00831 [Leptomonas pyrrhocoris]|eukprot:XP_015665195.1 hypothetical protein ABB37_00831 [Leptomonas pyrrhocoris]
MSVNEAPRLTMRVVVLFMMVVFFFCLLADQLQCSKNGRQRFCTGRAPYHCRYDHCREEIVLPFSASRDSTCMFKGTTEILLALIEVGPSLVSERGSTISAYMAEELRGRINASSFPRPVKNGNAGRKARSYWNSIYVSPVDEYYRLSRKLEETWRTPGYATRFTVSNDVIPLPLYQHGSPLAYTLWTDAVEAVLPTSSRDDPTQLKRHFPNLYVAFDAAVARRKRSTTENAACDSINIIVYILVSPLASVREVWELPESAKQAFSEAYRCVAGAVTRYLSTNKRLFKYLSGVKYVYFFVPPPSRQFIQGVLPKETKFSPTDAVGVSSEAPKQLLTADNALVMAVADVPASLAFCNASTSAAHTTQCTQGCRNYDVLNSRAAAVSASFSDTIRETTETYSSFYAASSLYHNCYFDVLSGGEPPMGNGTFGAGAEAIMFDDCLHLSPDGGKAFATCLLNTTAIVRQR